MCLPFSRPLCLPRKHRIPFQLYQYIFLHSKAFPTFIFTPQSQKHRNKDWLLHLLPQQERAKVHLPSEPYTEHPPSHLSHVHIQIAPTLTSHTHPKPLRDYLPIRISRTPERSGPHLPFSTLCLTILFRSCQTYSRHIPLHGHIYPLDPLRNPLILHTRKTAEHPRYASLYFFSKASFILFTYTHPTHGLISEQVHPGNLRNFFPLRAALITECTGYTSNSLVRTFLSPPLNDLVRPFRSHASRHLTGHISTAPGTFQQPFPLHTSQTQVSTRPFSTLFSCHTRLAPHLKFTVRDP